MNILVATLEKTMKHLQRNLPVLILTMLILGMCRHLGAQSVIPYQLSQMVYLDTLENCSYDVGEPELTDVFVIMELLPSGLSIGGYSGIGLIIAGAPPGDTLVRVYLSGFNNFQGGCPTVYEFPVSGDTSVQITLKIPVRAGNCFQMGVDISGAAPRPCFDRNYYVSAFNKGLQTAEDVYVDVTLDPNIAFQSSSLPGIPLPGNTWRFDLGDVEPLDKRLITIAYQLGCDVPIGQVICSEAAVYPDTFCQPGNTWNGAKVYAQASCDGDSAKFTLTNLSDVLTSPNLDYIIAEDLIMYQQDEFQLGPHEVIEFYLPANGATWHLSADQEPGYPGSFFTNATIEGCGTDSSGGNSTGIYLAYPFTPGLFNRATDCQEAVSSFDPNDKQGFPTGYGAGHYIRTNDEIKYQIRFQNTGTDTAYTVIVKEQLPAGLNPVSLIPGASSHPYTFFINATGEMTFRFEDIDLPDSTTNAPASNGFLSYRVRPMPDLPPGTLISGEAGIYFDFNPPVITNTVFHTIEEDFIPVYVNEVLKNEIHLNVFPNPAGEWVQVVWEDHRGQTWQVALFDATGRPLSILEYKEHKAILACGGLAPGLYFFRVYYDLKVAATGKIMIK